MTKDKKFWSEELLAFLTAPTFYVYFLGILIVFLAVYLPGLAGISELEVAKGDSLGFMAARYFASQLGGIILFLPCFAVSASALRDKEKRVRFGSAPRDEKDAREAVTTRVFAQAGLMFIPVLMAAVYETIALWKYGGSGYFILLSFTWLLPTLLFETALATAATEWTGITIPGIVVTLILWIFTQGSTADVGDYFTCIAVRHEVLGGFSEYSANVGTMTGNRIIIIMLAMCLVFAAIAGCDWKRNHTR